MKTKEVWVAGVGQTHPRPLGKASSGAGNSGLAGVNQRTADAKGVGETEANGKWNCGVDPAQDNAQFIRDTRYGDRIRPDVL